MGTAGPGGRRDSLTPDLLIDRATLPRKTIEPVVRPSQTGLHAFWLGAAALAGLSLSTHASIVIPCFPVFCFFGGIVLLRLSAAYLTEFLVWLWILSPFLRRMVEFHAGGADGALILTGPYIACCVPLCYLLPHVRRRFGFRLGPLALAFGALVYGLAVGIAHYPPATVFKSFLLWFAPLTFSIFVCSNPDLFEDLYGGFRRSMIYGSLIASIYGIYQFFFLPKWDAMWMLNLGNDTFGDPEPMKVRVFGTMNSPQILALFLSVGILLSFHGKSKLRLFVAPLAIFAMSFTMARTAWVSLGTGFFYLFVKARPKFKLQILALTIASATVLVAALNNSQVANAFSKRFSSLSNVQQDDSFVSRVDGHKALLVGMLNYPFGLGLGSQTTTIGPEAEEAKVSQNGAYILESDSSFAAVALSLGGAGLLMLGILFLRIAMSTFTHPVQRESYGEAIKLLCLVLATEFMFQDIVNGPGGFISWTVIALWLVYAQRSPSERQCKAVRQTAIAGS
jgi:O-Antigen ligase